MAKKRRRHGTELTPKELQYLCWGYTVAGRYFGAAEPFESEERAEEAWNNHADAVWEAFHADDRREALLAAGEYQEPWAARVFKAAG